MSDAYLDWEELVGPAVARTEAVMPPPAAATPDLGALLELDGIPAELRALVERRLQLRAQLDAFGGGSSEPVDARDAMRFEVPVHTAETRIAERRERRREEQAHLSRLHRQQQRVLARQRELAEADEARRPQADRVTARRRAEYDERKAAEAERRRRQADAVRRRWEDERRDMAAQWRAEAWLRQQGQQRWEQQRREHRAAASVERVLQRREERRLLEARLDRREDGRARRRGREDAVGVREVTWEQARDQRRDARREARP